MSDVGPNPVPGVDIPERMNDGSGIWHAAVLALAAATAVIASFGLIGVVRDGIATGYDLVRPSIGVIAPIAVAGFWLWARPRITRSGIYFALMAVSTVAVFALTWSHPGLAGSLSFLMPLTWLAAPGPKPAMIWTLVLMGSASAGMMLGGLADPWLVLFIAIFSVALSAAIGLSIQRLHGQVQVRQMLLEELQQKHDEVALLTAESAAARERASVLRDVHDAVTQNLTAIVMQARMPEHDPRLIEELAEEALEETRALLLKSTPRQLEQGLTTALARLAERFGRETGISVHTDIEQLSLSLDGEIVMLRAAQEALANVRKHSRATAADLSLKRASDDQVTLTIRDNGVGFDHAQQATWRGLLGIQERVREAGGATTFEGVDGATVIVELPQGAGS